MRFLPTAVVVSAATVIIMALQDNLFSSDPSSSSEISSLPNDDSLFDQNDIAIAASGSSSSSPDVLLSSDPSSLSLLSFASTNPAEEEAQLDLFSSSFASEQQHLELASSSCLGDQTSSTFSSDDDLTMPFSRRNQKRSSSSSSSILLAGAQCPSTDHQPVPFKNALPGSGSGLGGKIGDILKYIWLRKEEYIEDPERKKTYINQQRCLPTHPYHLCCLQNRLDDDDGDYVEGANDNEYWNCNSGMLHYVCLFVFSFFFNDVIQIVCARTHTYIYM